jgi:hypothetical protein
MNSNVNSDELMQAVMKNREKILVLERIVEELVNTGYVDQSDYRRFHKEAVEQVKNDFVLHHPEVNEFLLKLGL